jgi:hypothetical protein
MAAELSSLSVASFLPALNPYIEKIRSFFFAVPATSVTLRDVQFVRGWNFQEELLAWRMLGLSGRLRGGKTSLAVALARWLYLNGHVRGIFANMPIDPSYIPVVRSCLNTVVLLDESWYFNDSRKSANKFEGYGAFFGKLGSYLISPSVHAPDKRTRPLLAWREWDRWALGMWQYKYENIAGDEGSFILRNFDATFDHYDHRFVPLDDGGILEVLMREINEIGGSVRPVLTHKDWKEYQSEQFHKRQATGAR